MPPPNNSPPKVLGKLARKSSVHLQRLNIIRLTGSLMSGSPDTLSHNTRADLLTISGQSTSPLPQRMGSLTPIDTLPKNIRPLAIHTHRIWTHPKPPRRHPPNKGISNRPKYGKINMNATPRKLSKLYTNQTSMENYHHIQHILRIPHKICSHRRNINSG